MAIDENAAPHRRTRADLAPPTGPEWTRRLHRLQPLSLARTRRAAQFIWLAKVNLVGDLDKLLLNAVGEFYDAG
jgi:hypothetical protein